MQFTIQVTTKDEHGQTKIEDIIEFDKPTDNISQVGLTLRESKELLKALQRSIVSHQAEQYTADHRQCHHCQKPRRVKGQHTIQYRTLFGIVSIPSLRVYGCHCADSHSNTISVLTNWLPEHNSPELLYLETKWAALISYGLTADLLKEVLPVGWSLNAATVRNHYLRAVKLTKRRNLRLSRCHRGKPS